MHLSQVSSIRAHFHSWVLYPNHLIIYQRLHLLVPIHWGLSFNTWILEVHKHSVYYTHVPYNQYKQCYFKFSCRTFSPRTVLVQSVFSWFCNVGCMSCWPKFYSFGLILGSISSGIWIKFNPLVLQILTCLKQDILSALTLIIIPIIPHNSALSRVLWRENSCR